MGRRHVTKGERSFISVPEEPWVPISRSMLESPAWRVLSRAGFLVISRLCVEHAKHGGKENGRLAVSFDDFEKFGIDRHAIKRTLLEVDQLGFVRCTLPGRRAWGADPGRVATYRITFGGVVGDNSGPRTDEWRLIGEDDAGRIAARAKSSGRRRKANGHADGDGLNGAIPPEI